MRNTLGRNSQAPAGNSGPCRPAESLQPPLRRHAQCDDLLLRPEHVVELQCTSPPTVLVLVGRSAVRQERVKEEEGAGLERDSRDVALQQLVILPAARACEPRLRSRAEQEGVGRTSAICQSLS